MILWGLRKGERFARAPTYRSGPGFERTCRAFVPGSFGSAVEWFDLDARSRRGLGHLFAPRERRKKSGQRHGRQLSARGPLCSRSQSWLFPGCASTRYGIVYAVLSGAIASGVGYVIWYTALPGLKAASAATVQLSVPVLAATGGILCSENRSPCASVRVHRGPGRHRARRDRTTSAPISVGTCELRPC